MIRKTSKSKVHKKLLTEAEKRSRSSSVSKRLELSKIPSKRRAKSAEKTPSEKKVSSREVLTNKQRLNKLTTELAQLHEEVKKKLNTSRQEILKLEPALQWTHPLRKEIHLHLGNNTHINIFSALNHLFNAHKGMQVALLDNLDANYKAMQKIAKMGETRSLTPKEQRSFDKAFEEFDKVQKQLREGLNSIGRTPTVDGLKNLKANMDALSKKMESKEINYLLLSFVEENSEAYTTFKQHLQSSQEIMSTFDKALDALKKVPLKEDNKDFSTILDEAIEKVRKSDAEEDMKSRESLSTMLFILALAILFTTVLLAIIVLSGPIGTCVALLGMAMSVSVGATAELMQTDRLSPARNLPKEKPIITYLQDLKECINLFTKLSESSMSENL